MAYPIDLKLCTVLHFQMCILSGYNYFPKRYSESKRGGGCKVACGHFSYMDNFKTLHNASLPCKDVHIVGNQGSNYFIKGEGGNLVHI